MRSSLFTFAPLDSCAQAPRRCELDVPAPVRQRPTPPSPSSPDAPHCSAKLESFDQPSSGDCYPLPAGAAHSPSHSHPYPPLHSLPPSPPTYLPLSPDRTSTSSGAPFSTPPTTYYSDQSYPYYPTPPHESAAQHPQQHIDDVFSYESANIDDQSSFDPGPAPSGGADQAPAGGRSRSDSYSLSYDPSAPPSASIGPLDSPAYPPLQQEALAQALGLQQSNPASPASPVNFSAVESPAFSRRTSAASQFFGSVAGDAPTPASTHGFGRPPSVPALDGQSVAEYGQSASEVVSPSTSAALALSLAPSPVIEQPGYFPTQQQAQPRRHSQPEAADQDGRPSGVSTPTGNSADIAGRVSQILEGMVYNAHSARDAFLHGRDADAHARLGDLSKGLELVGDLAGLGPATAPSGGSSANPNTPTVGPSQPPQAVEMSGPPSLSSGGVESSPSDTSSNPMKRSAPPSPVFDSHPLPPAKLSRLSEPAESPPRQPPLLQHSHSTPIVTRLTAQVPTSAQSAVPLPAAHAIPPPGFVPGFPAPPASAPPFSHVPYQPSPLAISSTPVSPVIAPQMQSQAVPNEQPLPAGQPGAPSAAAVPAWPPPALAPYARSGLDLGVGMSQTAFPGANVAHGGLAGVPIADTRKTRSASLSHALQRPGPFPPFVDDPLRRMSRTPSVGSAPLTADYAATPSPMPGFVMEGATSTPPPKMPVTRRRAQTFSHEVPKGDFAIGSSSNPPPGFVSEQLPTGPPFEPALKAKLDKLFLAFLNRICSDLEATDSKGEPIHQTLMAKKMQRLDESTDFRPFKFRIQAFTMAYYEDLQRQGLGDDIMPVKRVKQYLWTSPYIARFNEDGKKAKSKGNHIWNISARKKPDGGWEFMEFTRKISGQPPSVAYVGLRWTWTPRLWDPQSSVANVKAHFSSPALPYWLGWDHENNTLSGVPDASARSTEIVVEARYSHNGTDHHLRTSFILNIAPSSVGSSSRPSMVGYSAAVPGMQLPSAQPPPQLPPSAYANAETVPPPGHIPPTVTYPPPLPSATPYTTEQARAQFQQLHLAPAQVAAPPTSLLQEAPLPAPVGLGAPSLAMQQAGVGPSFSGTSLPSLDTAASAMSPAPAAAESQGGSTDSMVNALMQNAAPPAPAP